MILDYQKVAHIFIVCGKESMAWLPSYSMSIIWMRTTMVSSYFVAADEIVSKCCMYKRWFPSFIQAIGSRTASLTEIKKRNSLPYSPNIIVTF
ncbi:hypothetical protein [Enterococcus sp. DIV1420a]|uniref:hypothetical protein n=1 Tax=Enterococcus sp. DIV1420a TaxID=2774672 RepID=UPI003F1FB76B